MKRSLLLLAAVLGLAAIRPAAVGAQKDPLRAGDRYVRVIPGDLPIVFGVPHGGDLRPDSVAERVGAVVVNDPGIQAFAIDLAEAIAERSGHRPTLVFNLLDRSKLDPNRGLAFGAQGDPVAEQVWRSYHRAIEQAAEQAVAQCGRGHFFDLHSHGQAGRWIELGYGLSAEDLQETDQDLAKRRFVYASNWRVLALTSPATLPELIRGPYSLGGLLEADGYRVVPSPTTPAPDEGYFDGGYSVYLHGSQRGGAVDATQIEAPYDLLQEPWRQRFTDSLAEAILQMTQQFYGLTLDGADDRVCSPFVDVGALDPAYPALVALDQVGAVTACRDVPRQFCPSSSLTRREAAAMAWQALYPTENDSPAVELAFSDLTAEGLPDRAAQALWERGFLSACGVLPLRYCPQAWFTRVELAKLVLKIQRGRAYLPPVPAVSDPVGIRSQWGTWWLAEAVAAGLLEPCSPVETAASCAARPVSRAEMVIGLARSLDLISSRTAMARGGSE